jgi:hypothetical protein
VLPHFFNEPLCDRWSHVRRTAFAAEAACIEFWVIRQGFGCGEGMVLECLWTIVAVVLRQRVRPSASEEERRGEERRRCSYLRQIDSRRGWLASEKMGTPWAKDADETARRTKLWTRPVLSSNNPSSQLSRIATYAAGLGACACSRESHIRCPARRRRKIMSSLG